MNEKEIIEEMKKDLMKIRNDLRGCYLPQSVGAYEYAMAKDLTNLRYRKLLEGSVVLSKEELNDLEYKAYSRGVCLVCEKVDEQKEKVRKETAKEILKALTTVIHDNTKYGGNFVVLYLKDLQELAKQFGVEVEE